MTDIYNFKMLTTWHDCECCGSYYDMELEIYRGEDFVTSFYKDGHFGNGDNVEDIVQMLPKIFEAIGLKATCEEITTDAES